MYKNPNNDTRGPWKSTPLHAKIGTRNYTFKFKNGIEWTVPSGMFPRYSIETLRRLDNENKIWFEKIIMLLHQ
jgi:adenine-specific DNA-methyltransferase